MKKIKLTQGLFAIVDDEDFDRLNAFKWYASRSGRGRKFYARRKTARPNSKTISMHREILGLTDPRIKGDHKNNDSLDYRRENLRPTTNAQNVSNRGGANKNSKSGIRGVFWHQASKKWSATIKVNGKAISLGTFLNAIEAAAAYADANRKYFGDFGGGL